MRQSKRLYWEIMTQLEEAGEEDMCSLLNTVMGAQPYFGSGADLAEYLQAIDALLARGDLQVREYRFEGAKRVLGPLQEGDTIKTTQRFAFDATERLWRCKSDIRMNVELPDGNRA